MKDQLTECRKCKSPLCYERHQDGLISWDCLQCGYGTNTLLLENTEAILGYESMIPTLFRDIKFVDEDSFVWYPTTLTKDGIGIIFPDIESGKPASTWKWAVARQIPVEEHEKEKFRKKDGTYHQYKTDMKNVLHFDQQYFSQALEALGFI